MISFNRSHLSGIEKLYSSGFGSGRQGAHTPRTRGTRAAPKGVNPLARTEGAREVVLPLACFNRSPLGSPD